jgi:uncharacterized surface protein with fasciclin (FAS1) repeats
VKFLKSTSFHVALASLLLVGAIQVSISAGDKYKSSKDIIETAADAGQFKTLAVALTEAGLIETLKGDGPFTVFAPTDEAFAKIPKGTLDNLLKNKEQLTKVLLYHVVPGKVTAEQVVKANEAKTVEGANVKIVVKDGTVMIDNAKVVKTDIMASNGVIHVIDTVIMPPAEQAIKKSK